MSYIAGTSRIDASLNSVEFGELIRRLRLKCSAVAMLHPGSCDAHGTTTNFDFSRETDIHEDP